MNISSNPNHKKQIMRNSPLSDSERLQQGPVAIIECDEEIPCNPCETSCPRGAIYIGKPITNRPALAVQKCIGCGNCISKCPGLAIFVVDRRGEEDKVWIPYEFLPLPKPGQVVIALDREGKPLCDAYVEDVRTGSDRTYIIILRVPKGLGIKTRFLRLQT